MVAAEEGNDLAETALAASRAKERSRRKWRSDMVRKIRERAQIVAGLAVVCASAISSAQAQPPVVYVEDCGKTPIFVCADSGQRIGAPSYRTRAIPFRHVRHFQPSYDLPTREREWLWNDP